MILKCRTLTPLVLVRIQVPQPKEIMHADRGRPIDFAFFAFFRSGGQGPS
jgi:hypothetical protein